MTTNQLLEKNERLIQSVNKTLILSEAKLHQVKLEVLKQKIAKTKNEIDQIVSGSK